MPVSTQLVSNTLVINDLFLKLFAVFRTSNIQTKGNELFVRPLHFTIAYVTESGF